MLRMLIASSAEALVSTYSVCLSIGGVTVAEMAGDPRKLSIGAQQLRGFDVKDDEI